MRRRIVLLALLLALWPAAALAHGGGLPRIVNQPLGPYTISVWSSPDPLTVGTAHLTVALAEGGQPLLDRDVRIVATPPNGEAPLTARATHADATIKLYYETDLQVETTGRWRFSVTVDNGADAATFEADVRAQSWTRSPWLAAVAVLVVGAAWWLTRGRGETDG